MREILLQKSREPLSVDAERKTARLNFYTGAVVDRFSWLDGPYKLRLSLDPKHVDLSRLNSGRAPVLDGHMAFSVRSALGVVERAWLAEGGGYADIQFSDRDEVAPIFEDVRAGIMRNVSVGTSILKFEDITPKGENVKTLLATEWAPEEISLVPIGADPDAQVLSAAAISPADMITHLQMLAGASSRLGALEAQIADLTARVKFIAEWRRGR